MSLDFNSPEPDPVSYGPFPINRAVAGLRATPLQSNAELLLNSGIRSGILLHTGEWNTTIGWYPSKEKPGLMPNSEGCVHSWPMYIQNIAELLPTLGVKMRKNPQTGKDYPFDPQGLLSVELAPATSPPPSNALKTDEQLEEELSALAPRRRVMAWMALTANVSDNLRQLAEAKRRANANNLTDISPTFFGASANGTFSAPWPAGGGVRTPCARCGNLSGGCRAFVAELKAAGLRVHPLIAAWGAGPLGGIAMAINFPKQFIFNAVQILGPEGLSVNGINIDFEASGANLCATPGSCVAETHTYYTFLNELSDAMHAMSPRLEVSVDWATFMGVSNYGSFEGLRDSKIDVAVSMDPYGKVDRFAAAVLCNVGLPVCR